jgi:hypothetical protein
LSSPFKIEAVENGYSLTWPSMRGVYQSDKKINLIRMIFSVCKIDYFKLICWNSIDSSETVRINKDYENDPTLQDSIRGIIEGVIFDSNDDALTCQQELEKRYIFKMLKL